MQTLHSFTFIPIVKNYRKNVRNYMRLITSPVSGYNLNDQNEPHLKTK